MITEITSNLASVSVYINDFFCILTSRIPDFTVKTSEESEIVHWGIYDSDKSPVGTGYFETDIYAVDGYAYISNIADIIEQHMRKSNTSIRSYYLRIGDNGGSMYRLRCIYCDYNLPQSFDIEKNFLSTLSTCRVHLNSLLSLTAFRLQQYDNTNYDFVIDAVYFDSNGVRRVETITVSQVSSTLTLAVSAIAEQLSEVAAEKNITVAKLLYFSVSCGDCQRVYFIDRCPQWQLFRYRNIFNVDDYFEVVGTTTTKTDISTDSAVVGGTTIQYDHLATRTYSVETAAMTQAQAEAVDQLFNSRDIALVDTDGSEIPVIITEHTCEISNSDESLATVKFTWRFANERPRLLADVVAIHPAAGVFDDTFNAVFV